MENGDGKEKVIEPQRRRDAKAEKERRFGKKIAPNCMSFSALFAPSRLRKLLTRGKPQFELGSYAP
jgi:hypothetical protein